MCDTPRVGHSSHQMSVDMIEAFQSRGDFATFKQVLGISSSTRRCARAYVIRVQVRSMAANSKSKIQHHHRRNEREKTARMNNASVEACKQKTGGGTVAWILVAAARYILTSDNVGISSKRHILGSNTLANRTGPPDFLQRFATTEALAQLRGAYASQCIVVCLSKYRLFALRRS